MKTKIKHAIAYIILIATFFGLVSALWVWIVKPVIVLFIKLGLVKSLIFLFLLIGLGVFIWFIGWTSKKLINWLLEE
jgi:hypothetical protein